MKRIVICGGTGLIGNALSQKLNLADFEVVILTRDPNNAPKMPAAVKLQQWDGKSAKNWGGWAEGATAIVNLAGASILGDGLLPDRWTPQRKQLLRQSREDSCHAVIEAIEQTEIKPKAYIQASAVGCYGVHRDDRILDETSPHGSDFLADLCQENWEMPAQKARDFGVRLAIARIGIVFSPAGGALPKLVAPFKFFCGGWLGSGKQWISWIHIDDVIAGIQYLIENEAAQGAYNLTAPQPETNKTVSKAIGATIGRPAWLPVPAFALRLAMGEQAMTVLEGQRAVPKKLQEEAFQFRYPLLEPALQNLLP